MRSAGRIVAEVLALVEESLKPGVSTAELDRLAERHIRASGGIPSFLGYLGGRRYDPRRPARVPGLDLHLPRRTRSSTASRATGRSAPGQIVSVDVGVIYDGWHGDGARSFICGGDAAGTPGGGRPGRRRRGSRSWRGSLPPCRATGSAYISGAVEDVAPRRRLRHRPPVRGSRHRHVDARGPAGPQLPLARRRGSSWRSATAWPSSRCSRWARRRPRRSPTAGPCVTVDGSLAAHFEHTIAITATDPRS